MAPKYKVTYFDARGIGEPIRYLLSYGGVDFEDNRIAYDNWPNVKSSYPFCKLPVLEVDGKVIHQSGAIYRYLAKQFGLYGSNDFEAAQIESIADTIGDLKDEIVKYAFRTEESQKAEKKETLLKETLPLYMSRFEKIVGENKGYFVNGKLSYADILIVALLDFWFFCIKSDPVAGYPNLKSLVEKVNSNPRIKAWVAKRPKTDY